MRLCVVCHEVLPTHRYKYCNDRCKSKDKKIKSNVYPNLRAKLFNRDKGVCAYCREQNTKWFANHIVKIADGGKQELTNLRTLCPDCHSVDTVSFMRGRECPKL